MKKPKEIITNILEKMDIGINSIEEVIDHELEMTIFSVKTNDGRFFVQNNNEALNALNHLIQAIFEKDKKVEGVNKFNFIVDINFLNQKHLQDLKSKARIVAERARSFKTPIQMEPMPAYDRLVVHTFLSSYEDLSTDSEGEGFDRHIVVRLK